MPDFSVLYATRGLSCSPSSQHYTAVLDRVIGGECKGFKLE